MAKGKSTWKYNKLLTARRNYYGFGDFINKVAGNPSEDGKLTTGLFKGMNQSGVGLMKGLGTAVGGIGGNLISNGMTSGAGDFLQGLSGIAGAIPGPWGAVASAGLGLASGITNSLFGSKMNEENIAKVESNINSLNSFQSDASDYDTLASNWANAAVGMTFDDSFIGKDAVFSSKAKNKAADLRKQIEAGNTWVQNTLANNANNIGTTQIDDLLGNYSAFGGPLYFANAMKRKHAFGGDLLTHGSNFDTGVTLIGNGGTHEENPYEGVPMGVDSEGTPNLVEQGEVIFKDYVFSNRLTVPKTVRNKYKLRGTKPLTFAAAAKQLSKESEERPNDPISKAGLEDSMMKLMIAQEQLREKQASRSYAEGGKLGRKYKGPGELSQYLLLDRPLDTDDMSWMDELASLENAKNNTNGNDTKLYPTWMRYVPAFASGVMSITDAAGLTNKPDYSEANMVLDAARGVGTYSPVGFSPIGNYLGYTPFDREFYINQMNAQAGAIRRAIMQNAGLNRGAGMAALLASDYNTQGQFGQLARQAEEYNLAQRQKAEEFNRATNMFNTEGALKADMANQEAMLKVRDSYLKGTLSAAELRQRERQQSAAARSANLSNFINSLGDIGRENFARNMIVSDPSKYYSIGANGEISYKASFDDLSEAEQDYVRGHASRKSQGKKARGGYLTRKKKR